MGNQIHSDEQELRFGFFSSFGDRCKHFRVEMIGSECNHSERCRCLMRLVGTSPQTLGFQVELKTGSYSEKCYEVAQIILSYEFHEDGFARSVAYYRGVSDIKCNEQVEDLEKVRPDRSIGNQFRIELHGRRMRGVFYAGFLGGRCDHVEKCECILSAQGASDCTRRYHGAWAWGTRLEKLKMFLCDAKSFLDNLGIKRPRMCKRRLFNVSEALPSDIQIKYAQAGLVSMVKRQGQWSYGSRLQNLCSSTVVREQFVSGSYVCLMAGPLKMYTSLEVLVTREERGQKMIRSQYDQYKESTDCFVQWLERESGDSICSVTEMVGRIEGLRKRKVPIPLNILYHLEKAISLRRENLQQGEFSHEYFIEVLEECHQRIYTRECVEYEPMEALVHTQFSREEYFFLEVKSLSNTVHQKYVDMSTLVGAFPELQSTEQIQRSVYVQDEDCRIPSLVEYCMRFFGDDWVFASHSH